MNVQDIVKMMTKAGCTDAQIKMVTGLTASGLKAARNS